MLDFWYDFASAYSHPAAMVVERRASDAGVVVRWRPFLLGTVLHQQRGLATTPLAGHAEKARYLAQDVARTCRDAGVAWTPPTVTPRASLAALRAALACEAQGLSIAALQPRGVRRQLRPRPGHLGRGPARRTPGGDRHAGRRGAGSGPHTRGQGCAQGADRRSSSPGRLRRPHLRHRQRGAVLGASIAWTKRSPPRGRRLRARAVQTPINLATPQSSSSSVCAEDDESSRGMRSARRRELAARWRDRNADRPSAHALGARKAAPRDWRWGSGRVSERGDCAQATCARTSTSRGDAACC